jgi:hypothetical protein
MLIFRPYMTGVAYLFAAGLLVGLYGFYAREVSREPVLFPPVTCAEFSFRAFGREDVIRARRQFYEAALQMKAISFSDSSSEGLWPKTHAELFFGVGGRIVFGGSSDYPDRADPASSLTVYWFDQGKTYQGATSIPCTWPTGKDNFDKVRTFFRSWDLSDDKQMPTVQVPGGTR